MKKEKIKRNRWLNIRLSESEMKKIQLGFSRSVNQKRSEYVRNILLDKPITVYTRNQSFDDFVAEIILLKNELKFIGNNFNQTVRKLHTLTHDQEIKSWAILNEKSKDNFFKKVAEIQLKINEISDKWLQE